MFSFYVCTEKCFIVRPKAGSAEEVGAFGRHSRNTGDAHIFNEPYTDLMQSFLTTTL